MNTTHDSSNDPAEYISAGVTQAFSPMESPVIITDTLPPLHKQVKLSELKSTLKKDPHYFKDD